MKFALIALIATVAAYDESEGPTKVDLGESDDAVTYREFDTGNGVKFSGWNNPLAWTDNGNDDDAILVQTRDEDDDEANVVTEEQQRTADQIATGGHAMADTIDGDDKVL